MKNNQIFSFAANDVGPISRLFIRLTEFTTGQPKLKKIYDNYIKEKIVLAVAIVVLSP